MLGCAHPFPGKLLWRTLRKGHGEGIGTTENRQSERLSNWKDWTIVVGWKISIHPRENCALAGISDSIRRRLPSPLWGGSRPGARWGSMLDIPPPRLANSTSFHPLVDPPHKGEGNANGAVRCQWPEACRFRAVGCGRPPDHRRRRPAKTPSSGGGGRRRGSCWRRGARPAVRSRRAARLAADLELDATRAGDAAAGGDSAGDAAATAVEQVDIVRPEIEQRVAVGQAGRRRQADRAVVRSRAGRPRP